MRLRLWLAIAALGSLLAAGIVSTRLGPAPDRPPRPVALVAVDGDPIAAPRLGPALAEALTVWSDDHWRAVAAITAELDRQRAEAARQADDASRKTESEAARAKVARTPPTRSPSMSPRTSSPVVSGSVWDDLAGCESGGDWSANTGNGFEGGIQFTHETWLHYRPAGAPYHAYDASRADQITAGKADQAENGWHSQWPACSRRLGL